MRLPLFPASESPFCFDGQELRFCALARHDLSHELSYAEFDPDSA